VFFAPYCMKPPGDRGPHPHRRVCVLSHGTHHEANGSLLSRGSSISTGPGVAPGSPARPVKAGSWRHRSIGGSVFTVEQPHRFQIQLNYKNFPPREVRKTERARETPLTRLNSPRRYVHRLSRKAGI